MEDQPETEEDKTDGITETETVDALTAHFRRTSRGRVVDLPRWAQ